MGPGEISTERYLEPPDNLYAICFEDDEDYHDNEWAAERLMEQEALDSARGLNG